MQVVIGNSDQLVYFILDLNKVWNIHQIAFVKNDLHCLLSVLVYLN